MKYVKTFEQYSVINEEEILGLGKLFNKAVATNTNAAPAGPAPPGPPRQRGPALATHRPAGCRGPAQERPDGCPKQGACS